MGDMLRTSPPFTGHDWFLEVQRMLHAIAWAIRSTVNTAICYTPGQLAFHRDMITATRVRVDWDRIYRSRSETILKVYTNGTIRLLRGAYAETIHIRQIKPFLVSDNEVITEPHLDGKVFTIYRKLNLQLE